MSGEEKKQAQFVWVGSLDNTSPTTMALDVAGLRFDFVIAKRPPLTKEAGAPNIQAPTMFWIHARVNGHPWDNGALSISYPSARSAVRACEGVLTKILSTLPGAAPVPPAKEGA